MFLGVGGGVGCWFCLLSRIAEVPEQPNLKTLFLRCVNNDTVNTSHKAKCRKPSVCTLQCLRLIFDADVHTRGGAWPVYETSAYRTLLTAGVSSVSHTPDCPLLSSVRVAQALKAYSNVHACFPCYRHPHPCRLVCPPCGRIQATASLFSVGLFAMLVDLCLWRARDGTLARGEWPRVNGAVCRSTAFPRKPERRSLGVGRGVGVGCVLTKSDSQQAGPGFLTATHARRTYVLRLESVSRFCFSDFRVQRNVGGWRNPKGRVGHDPLGTFLFGT